MSTLLGCTLPLLSTNSWQPAHSFYPTSSQSCWLEEEVLKTTPRHQQCHWSCFWMLHDAWTLPGSTSRLSALGEGFVCISLRWICATTLRNFPGSPVRWNGYLLHQKLPGWADLFPAATSNVTSCSLAAISAPLSHILVNRDTAAEAKWCFGVAPAPKAICTSRRVMCRGGCVRAAGIWQAARAGRGGMSGGKQDGLEQMNVVKPEGCMSFFWSVSKMSYWIKETICLLLILSGLSDICHYTVFLRLEFGNTMIIQPQKASEGDC